MFALLAALAVGGCGDDGPVRLGFLGGLTGRVGDLGQQGRNGALLAVEEANASGGIGGRRIELLVRDDRQDEATARQAVEELAKAGVVAVIGPMTSAMAVAIVPTVNERRLPTVSPTTSTNELTGRDDWFIRIYPASRDAGRQLAEHAYRHLGLRAMTVALDLGNRAHTESWLHVFRAAFEALGGRVAAAPTFNTADQETLRPVAQEIAASGGDGVLILANAFDTALICQHLRRFGYAGPVLTSEWSATDDLLTHGGAAVEGLSFLHTFDRDGRTPRYLTFRDAFRQRFNEEPGFAAVHAYDATRIVIEALRRGARDRAGLRRLILEQGTFRGLQVDLAIDRFGDVQRRLFMMTVHGGRFTAVE
jgi:branched-chain amino acid transport system substrate-binding protein